MNPKLVRDPKDIKNLPPELLRTLADWANPLVKPKPLGSFLQAVLENRLDAAIFRADSQNLLLLPAIVMWLSNEAPAAAWGDPEKVKAWRFAKERP